jgi:diguanylate cyclase (GGDEF)-like protein
MRRWRVFRIPVDVHLTLVRTSDGSPGHFLVQVQDATERRRHEQELEFLADHDPLTNLLNRRAFLRTLDRHRRHRDEAGAVIMLDLDALKEVNDGFGHHAGDELIVATATISRSHLRSTDVIARLGGDEFAVLLPGTSPEVAMEVARDLLAALNARTDADGAVLRPIRASVGVTAFGTPLSDSSARVLQRADFAMYEAKREGGSRVRLAPALSGVALLTAEA